MLILAHGYLLVILWWSPYEDSSFFYKSWHNGVHNCLNTYLYALWSTLILNLMLSISFFSWFVFNEFIDKGGEYEHKVGRTLANRVDERRNMINDYLTGKACIDSIRGADFRGSVDFELLPWLELFLALLYHFAWLCRFSCRLVAFAGFLLPDDLLEFFLAFRVF
jgi:hypothetical protein